MTFAIDLVLLIFRLADCFDGFLAKLAELLAYVR